MSRVVDSSEVGGKSSEDLVGGLGPHERRGLLFHSWIQRQMSASSSVTLQCAEWRSLRLVSLANHRSTRWIVARFSLNIWRCGGGREPSSGCEELAERVEFADAPFAGGDRQRSTIAKSARPSRVRQDPPELRCWILTGGRRVRSGWRRTRRPDRWRIAGSCPGGRGTAGPAGARPRLFCCACSGCPVIPLATAPRCQGLRS